MDLFQKKAFLFQFDDERMKMQTDVNKIFETDRNRITELAEDSYLKITETDKMQLMLELTSPKELLKLTRQIHTMNKHGIKAKIYSAKYEKADHNQEPGEIETTKKVIKVACIDGYILVKELQRPGKRKMDSASLLNGYSFDVNSKLS